MNFVIEGTCYVLSTRQTMPFSQKDMQNRMKMTESCCMKIFWGQNFVIQMYKNNLRLKMDTLKSCISLVTVLVG